MNIGLVDALKILAPIIIMQLLLHYQNRKDAKAAQLQRHFVDIEYSPHLHEEEEGRPLTESGIRYPKVRLNGNGSDRRG